MVGNYFSLSRHGTTVSREIKAGIATFLTLSYILFVQPAVLSGTFLGTPTGMDFGALLTGTCLASALGTLLMALYARLPIVQAPGMGENFFFMTSLLPAAVALGYDWQVALAAVFFVGLLFFLLTLLGVTSRMMLVFSPSMRHGLVVGIGLFIALIGLQSSGLIVKNVVTGLELGELSASSLVFFIGLLSGGVFHAYGYKSYILWSILIALLTALALHWIAPQEIAFLLPSQIVSLPHSLSPLFMKLDFSHLFSLEIIPLILILLVLSVFDAVGTLIAVAKEAHLMEGEHLPRAKQALLSNSLAAMAGSLFGMSTVTSYMESLAGVEQGGRTGLSSLTVAIFFLLALFFYPLIAMIANYPLITAPALVLVGAIMIRSVKNIDWSDYTEMLPSFLMMICIPFFFSIANGIGAGLVLYPLLKILTGRVKELNPFNISLGGFFLAYFIFLR